MRLRHIEIFHAVMSTGSVTAAAEVLNISQPAVSKSLRAAAEEAGFPLFVSVKGRLRPTPEARRLHREVRVVFAEVEALRRVASDYRDGRGDRLRVSATPALGLEVLPRAVALLNSGQHRRLPISITTAHSAPIVDDVLAGHSDIGIGLNLPDHPNLERTVLAQAHLVCVLPATTSPRPGPSLTLAELSHLGLIGLERYDPLGILLQKAYQQAGLEMAHLIEVQTYHIALALVAKGLGVAVLDPFTARLGTHVTVAEAGDDLSLLKGEKAPQEATVLLRRLDPPLPITVHAVTASATPQGQQVKHLIAALRSVLNAIPKGGG